MKYFATALPHQGDDLFAKEFEAPDFMAAVAETITQAKAHFGGGRFEITGISMQPHADTHLLMQGIRHGEHFQQLREAGR
jgi:hypothetical protein